MVYHIMFFIFILFYFIILYFIVLYYILLYYFIYIYIYKRAAAPCRRPQYSERTEPLVLSF